MAARTAAANSYTYGDARFAAVAGVTTRVYLRAVDVDGHPQPRGTADVFSVALQPPAGWAPSRAATATVAPIDDDQEGARYVVTCAPAVVHHIR